MRPPKWIAFAAVCQVSMGLWSAVGQAAPAPGQGASQLLVSEIFMGTQANPTAQYVVLRMQGTQASDTSNVLGYSLLALDASGSKAPLGMLAMDRNLEHASPGAPVLIATQDAADFFGVAPDFVWRAPQMPREGALCVLRPGGGYDDCVLYGAKQANSLTQLDPNVTNNPLNEAGGIVLGAVAQRIGQTADSAQDFVLRRAPWPQNNTGVIGQAPPSTCGDGVVEGLEACDAGASCGQVGGSCTALCTWSPQGVGAVCGNGLVEPGESCDDFNTVDLDGCSSSCQWEYAPLGVLPVCGNGRLESGEACDGGPANGQGQVPCSASCTLVTGLVAQPNTCGNGSVESPLVLPFAQTRAEQCDLGTANGQSQSTCSSACRFVAATHKERSCGNGTVEPGEECDDGNQDSGDGCSSTCALEMATFFVCGDAVLDPTEGCDHGSVNGAPGDTCSAHCTLVPSPDAVAAAPVTPPQSAGSASAVALSGPSSAAVRGGSCQAAGEAPWLLSLLVWAGQRARRRAGQKASS